ARGEEYVARALGKALRDRRAPLAVSLIEQLRDMPMSDELLPAPGTNLNSYLAAKGAFTGTFKPAPRSVRATPVSRPAVTTPNPRPARTTTPQAPRPARTTPTPARTTPAPAPTRTQPAPARTGPAPSGSSPIEELNPDGTNRKLTDPETKPDSGAEEIPPPPPGSGSRRKRRISDATPQLVPGLDPALAFEPFGPQPQRTLQSGKEGATALAAALIYDDKRVRYAAAEALVRMAPNRKFAGADRVTDNLSGAIRESGNRVILVVARDQQVRNRLISIVRQLNYMPFAVVSGKAAIVRTRTAPVHDAVIAHTENLNQDLSSAEFLEQVKKDYRTQKLPILFATPSADVRRKTQLFPTAAGVISDEIDPVVLRDKLEALWSDEEYSRPNDPKRKSIEVAKSAANSIAEANPETSIFKLSECVPALIEAVQNQPAEVQIPALRALGRLQAREAADQAALVFENTRNKPQVRVAAAYCLGEALRDQTVPTNVFQAMLTAMEKGDRELYRACGEALGKTRLKRDQAIEMFERLRVQ
ncbi:MAG: hypothetical protein ACYTFT_07790, partial [Planctomycetota bacterium]